MRTALCLVGIVVVGTAWAQTTGKFSVQFDATPLNRVLDALKRFDASLQFAMAPELGDRKITASLVDVTVDEALQVVLSLAGLTSVKDNGVYQIREKASASGGRGPGPAARLPAPVFVNRPTAPGEGTSAARSATQAAGAQAATAEQKRNLPIRVITIKYADPALMAMLFGGYVIYGDEGSSGGSNSNSSSSGSYGSSSGGSSSGSSRGSSSGSSSRGSSSSSSSRSSSSSSRSR
jgi:hypothetical protein